MAAPSTRRRILAAAIPAAILAALVIAHRPALRALVRGRAATLGVDLDFDDLSLGRGALRLEGVHASPRGVPGVRVDATAARLGTSWLTLTSVDAEGATVSVDGSAASRALDLARWASDHPGTLRTRVSASEVRVTARAGKGAPEWLAISGGWLTSDGKSARFTAAQAKVNGAAIGSISAAAAIDATSVSLDIGDRPGAAPTLAVKLVTGVRPALSFTLRPVPIAPLGAALGASLPATNARASGSAELAWTGGSSPIQGSAAIEIDGWIPPHPRELSAVITGKKTTAKTKVILDPDRSRVKLDGLEVRAGKLALTGAGTITAEGDHAWLKVDLSGPIACADLARGVAREQVGGPLGALAGDLAGRAVSGSATVSVTVEGDSRDLGAAKVKPKVGLGCGLAAPGF